MKASSESGLWATLTSRTLPAVLAMSNRITLVSGSPRSSLGENAECLQTMAQSRPDFGCQHYLHHLREQEGIKAERGSELPALGQDRQPRQSTGEKYHLGDGSGHDVACEGDRSSLGNPSGEKCHYRVSPKVASR